MVRKKQYGLVVYFAELNSYEYLTELLQQILGYEVTQAANCASIVMDKGKYVVKTYKSQDLDKANIILDLLAQNGIPAKLIEL